MLKSSPVVSSIGFHTVVESSVCGSELRECWRCSVVAKYLVVNWASNDSILAR